jgi:hypothetical protein
MTDYQRWLDRYCDYYTDDADRAAGYHDYVANRAVLADVFGGRA